MKHCPICNRSSAEARFFGQFCEYCTKSNLMLKVPQTIIVEKCKRCGKVRTGDSYVREDLDSIEIIINKQIKPFKFHIDQIEDGKVSGYMEGMDGMNRVEAAMTLEMKYEKKMCHPCYLMSADYYEGVIQLRGANSKVKKQVENITHFFEANDGFITRLKQIENGVDMYVSSKKLANAYMMMYKMKPIMSFTLAGLQRGKKVYKNTYAVHLNALDPDRFKRK